MFLEVCNCLTFSLGDINILSSLKIELLHHTIQVQNLECLTLNPGVKSKWLIEFKTAAVKNSAGAYGYIYIYFFVFCLFVCFFFGRYLEEFCNSSK